jgi:hypothetical protein
MDNQIQAKYYNRSKLYYKLTFYAVVASILSTILFGVVNVNSDIKDIIIALPIFACYIICPLGLIFGILSYTNKEPFNKYRMYYLIGHIIFLLILLAFILTIFVDVRRL